MTDIQLRILVPLEEYKKLQKIARDHESCQSKRSFFKQNDILHENKSDLTLKDGSGSEQRQIINNEVPSDPCQTQRNIDQSVSTESKPIVVDSKIPETEKTNHSEIKDLPVSSIISQIRPRYRIKSKKLLNTLIEHPEDFSYDENGIVTIFNAIIPGNSCYFQS